MSSVGQNILRHWITVADIWLPQCEYDIWSGLWVALHLKGRKTHLIFSFGNDKKSLKWIGESLGFDKMQDYKRECLMASNVSISSWIFRIVPITYKFRFTKNHIKMIPLETHRRIWSWCCMCATDENPSIRRRIGSAILTFGILAVNFSVIPSSAIFVMKFRSTDIESCLFALFQVFTYIGIVYTIVIEIMFRKEVAAIFITLTKIYSGSKIINVYNFTFEIDGFHLFECR